MIGGSAAPMQSAISLSGASGGNVGNAGARGDASQDGVRFADFAASANASANAGTGTASSQDAAATTAASTGGGTLPSSAALPTQGLTSLQQQSAAAAAAATQAAALAADAAKLAAATAASATAHAAGSANAEAPTDALSMLAAMSAQDPADAAAPAAPTLTAPVAKTRDADGDTTPADTTLSQQMLALLAGSLAITAPAQPTQNAATLPTIDTSATGAGTSTASALMASNAASQLQQSPGLPQTGALSALLDPRAAAAPADVLNLAMNVALDADAGNAFAVPTDKDDKTALFGLSGTGVTAPTLDRTLTSNAVTATPLTMPARLDDGFDDGLGARIAWMAEQKLGHAQIRLNPENAGPIDVRIQLDGSQVNASFHSANADVRQALEASLPRLREMLGQQGMQLGNTDIGQRQAQQQSPQGQPTPRGFTGTDDGGSAMTGIRAQAAPIVIRSRGLLDEYA